MSQPRLRDRATRVIAQLCQCYTTSTSTAKMSDQEPYWLERNRREQERLAKQHHVWTKSIGYLLHPSIAPKLPEDAKIADIGTGTGIWLTEMAKVSPSTYQFDGYDISDAQFQAKDTLPQNVTLGFGDFKMPIPEELKGKYDLINIRLIVISMGVGVWESTLRNVLGLLKPGGAIQWIEGNFWVARGFRGTDAKSTGGHYLTKAQIQFNGTLKKRFGYNFPEWETMFNEAGLQNVEEDVLSTDSGLYTNRNWGGVWRLGESSDCQRRGLLDRGGGGKEQGRGCG
ncbi:hypothetical protein P154DRAFT_480012 [Amniculicola lignicola CBS 123094]|uniref:S-adenosyl-L-methionine-dependent methyltransferase n=1 Tax=Amniculicola lignicola CBS 123094 TaxID=1392246 RepID=A0A6A5X088_9PLEO|nr:hypothetical protein P154DRAFT_480012 [Amniculicola lignicola CBS 123094]